MLRLERKGHLGSPPPPTPNLLTSSSVFCFLATIPVLRASLFPPLRLPTWVKGQKTATVTGAGPALGGAEAHYTFLARPGGPSRRRAQLRQPADLRSNQRGAHATQRLSWAHDAQAILGPRAAFPRSEKNPHIRGDGLCPHSPC